MISSIRAFPGPKCFSSMAGFHMDNTFGYTRRWEYISKQHEKSGFNMGLEYAHGFFSRDLVKKTKKGLI